VRLYEAHTREAIGYCHVSRVTLVRRPQSGAAGGRLRGSPAAIKQPFGVAPLAARHCHRGSPDGIRAPGLPPPAAPRRFL